MVLAIIGSLLLLILIIIAAKVGLSKNDTQEEQIPIPVIHASGIYSIVRRSPKEELQKVRPEKEEIRKYLEHLNEDMGKYLLSEKDKAHILEHWEQSTARNLELIEQGDKEGVEFYYYEFYPDDCPECTKFFNKGQFVTREEIFKYPATIPPFHLGCTCRLYPHHGKEKLRDTTELGLLPFFKGEELPPLPEWKVTFKINVSRSTSV